MKRRKSHWLYAVFIILLSLPQFVYSATFIDTFDDSDYTSNNWLPATDVQQTWSFQTLLDSDSGYHASSRSFPTPAAKSADNGNEYYSENLYVEALVRIDAHPDAYSWENSLGLFFAKLDSGYSAGIQLDFDGPTDIDLQIGVINGETLAAQPVPIEFDTFYRLVFQIDAHRNIGAYLYELDGTLLGSVFADNAAFIDRGTVGLGGKPEVTFNNFKLIGNPVNSANLKTFYQDNDGDGYGNPTILIESNSQPPGYVIDNTDCNDNDSSVHPGATDIQNGVDDNCDGIIDSGLPSKATLLSPSGTISSHTPAYSWQEDPNSTWYELWVGDSGGHKIYSSWYEASTVCSNETCSATCNGSELSDDNYKWYIRSWSNEGSVWSSAKVFSVSGGDSTSAPEQADASSFAYNDSGLFSWDAVDNASWYELWVGDSTGRKVYQKWYRSSQVDNGNGQCSITPSLNLGDGDYNMYVRTYGNEQYGEWSGKKSFSVGGGDGKPAAAALIDTNLSGAENITYSWSAVSNSTWYYLWVNDETGTKIKKWYTAEQAGCASGTGTCSVTPTTTLDAGNAAWWIQTWNSDGYGPWSSEKNFSVEDSDISEDVTGTFYRTSSSGDSDGPAWVTIYADGTYTDDGSSSGIYSISASDLSGQHSDGDGTITWNGTLSDTTLSLSWYHSAGYSGITTLVKR